VLHLAAMSLRSVIRRAVLPTLLVLSLGNCLAQTPAVTGFSGGTVFATIDTTAQTAGWDFTANSNMTVSAIGFWEFDTSVPLNSTHQVGLWTSAGVLLASALVQVNSPVTGSWRYVAITPVTLTAGHTYVVGVDVTSPPSDGYERIPNPGGTVTTSGLITITSSAVSPSASGFAFPSVSEASFLARLGPNLLVQAVPTPTPTPGVPITPAGLAMIGVGLLALGLMVLRYRRTSVIR